MGLRILDRTKAGRVIMRNQLLVESVDRPDNQSIYHVQVAQTIPVSSYLFEVHRVVWISLICLTIMVVVRYVDIH